MDLPTPTQPTTAPDARGVLSINLWVAANILITTLAGQAVVQRQPTYAQQQRPQAVIATQSPNLLGNTLGQIIPPVISRPQSIAIDILRLGEDTSQGTPKTLYADPNQPPGGRRLESAPDLVRNVVNSARGFLPPPAAPPNPSGLNASHFAPAYFSFTPADSSHGMHKALFADASTPRFNYQWGVLDSVRPVSDTTSGTPEVAIAPAPQPPPIRFHQHSAPDRKPPVTDTSAGTPESILSPPLPLPPIRNHHHDWPDRPRELVEGSVGTSTGLLISALPTPPKAALILLPGPTPKFWWQPQDASYGIPRALFDAGAMPIRNWQPGAAPEPQRLFSDTNWQSALSLLAPSAPAPAEHMRTRIRNAAAAVLTGLSTSGSRVFASRLYAMRDEDLPGLRIYTKNEESTRITLASPALIERKVELLIECCAKQTTQIDVILDRMAKEVETTLSNNQTLSGLSRYVQLQGTEIDMNAEGDQPIGICSLRFEVLYLAMENAPETPV